MTSHPRRGNGPVRQHSLQQPPQTRRNHPTRRQKSAEEDGRCSQMRTTDNDRAKRETDARSNVDRPKIRIAWGDDVRSINDDRDSDRGVEIVARKISGSGKMSRSSENFRQSRYREKNFAMEKNGNGLMYSRRELADRLRLAWKEREANRSNIDVFLAHGTTENANDNAIVSRSSSPEPDASPRRSSFDRRSNDFSENFRSSEKSNKMENNVSTKGETTTNYFDNDNGETLISSNSTIGFDAARIKRASYRNAGNSAFLEIVDRTDSLESSIVAISSTNPNFDRSEVSEILNNSEKGRRHNSAGSQKRANSVGATSRTQVSIVIEAPRVWKTDCDAQIASIRAKPDDGTSDRTIEIVERPIKSAMAKRRAKSAKKRANSAACKDVEGGRGKLETKISEVVTMVSLVSDADSDTDIEDYCPREDKLINQLRSNLPTTPIIKNNVTGCGFANFGIRRPVKTVSFQQDSFDNDGTDDKRLAEKIRPQSVQVGRVTGSALPTPEESRSWRTEATEIVAISASSDATTRHRHDGREIDDTCLTDREKRCLVVPISDTRSDKKRKVLRTRSVAMPRDGGVDKQPTAMHHQNDSKEANSRSRISNAIENVVSVEKSTSILLQASVTKLVEETVVHLRTGDEPEADVGSIEPAFQTTKEKECWHLYRRMCDKGVCVSFDTVLRGMLTPTEYRLRRKETT